MSIVARRSDVATGWSATERPSSDVLPTMVFARSNYLSAAKILTGNDRTEFLKKWFALSTLVLSLFLSVVDDALTNFCGMV